MTADDHERGGFTLKRWSQRKLEAARLSEKSSAATVPAGEPLPPAVPSTGEAVSPAPATTSAAVPAPLPAVESLTIESDFTAFFKPEVVERLKQQALKQLFRDPHFNVMDGLDVYIDDYSQPVPLPADLARELVQGRYVFDPPKTRVNAQGLVEDVPADELAKSPAGAPEGSPEAEPDALPVVGSASPATPAVAAPSTTAPSTTASSAPVVDDDKAMPSS